VCRVRAAQLTLRAEHARKPSQGLCKSRGLFALAQAQALHVVDAARELTGPLSRQAQSLLVDPAAGIAVELAQVLLGSPFLCLARKRGRNLVWRWHGRRKSLVAKKSIEHRLARWGHLDELHAHPMRTPRFLGIIFADPRHFPGTKQKWRSLHEGDLELDHRTDRMRAATREKYPSAGHVGREPLDEDRLIGVAKLDSDDRDF